tara:strand:- start:9895 stop:10212 length:318 start_codon:yes stop_codon:yes gene_type:complete
MDQIEKTLSILLIVATIAYAFMYAGAGDLTMHGDWTSQSIYHIEASELSSTGYTIHAADLSKGHELDGICSETNDSTIIVDIDQGTVIETINNDSTIINDTEVEQ